MGDSTRRSGLVNKSYDLLNLISIMPKRFIKPFKLAAPARLRYKPWQLYDNIIKI